jgi:hypothetical protein
LAEKSWSILAENWWYILAEKPWCILAKNEWYIYVRELTPLDRHPLCPKAKRAYNSPRRAGMR